MRLRAVVRGLVVVLSLLAAPHVGGQPAPSPLAPPADPLAPPADPLAPPADPLAPAADELAPAGVPAMPPGATEAALVETLPEDCEGTNRAFWIGVVGMDVAALVLLFLAFWLAARKDWFGGGLLRLIVVALPFAVGAAVAIALIRPDAELVGRCLLDPDLRRLIVLNELEPWQRGVVLGALPAFSLAFVIKVFHGLVRR